MNNFTAKIVGLLQNDQKRMRALSLVSRLNLPDCLIAAGFVRNLIWDDCYQTSTPLNDIDVIYYNKEVVDEQTDLDIEDKLRRKYPEYPWSIKNQARMHLKYNNPAYQDSQHAMSFWPEIQTCIGVFLNRQGQLLIKHCFPLEHQFNGLIEPNPKADKDAYNRRIRTKQWTELWPALRIQHY